MDEEQYEAAMSEAGTAFSFSLTSKFRIVIATLLLSTVAAPAVYVRRDRIRTITGTESLSETLSLSVGVLIFFGIVTTLVAGLAFLRFAQQRSGGSMTKEELKGQLLIEDFFTFWLAFGVVLVWSLVPVLVVAGLFPSSIDWLYDIGVAVYRPFDAVTVDIRLVSGVGGVAALVLSAVWRLGT